MGRWRAPAASRGVALRLAAAAAFVGLLLLVILVTRPDLRHPSDLGTDTSNYLAAGQRLAEGHPLYRLQAGDRPSPQDDPPYWSGIPLLSPPPIAVLWRFLALLPPVPVMDAWWLAVAATGILFGAWLITRLRPLALLAAVPLLWGLALIAWSGNVNSFLLVAISGVWILAERTGGRRSGRPAAVGALVAFAAALKLTPILLAGWLLARGHRRALAWTVVFGVAIGLVSIAGAGLDAHLAYLAISRTTDVAGSTPYSVGGALRWIGAPAALVATAPIGVAVLGLVVVFALRNHPRAAFATAVIAAVFASPALRLDTLSMILPALVPWVEGAPE